MAGADVDHRLGESAAGGDVVDNGLAPLVGPICVAAGAHGAAKNLEVKHRHEAQAVGLDVRTCDAPEISGLGGGTVVVGLGEVISPHINAGGLAPAGVAG